MADLKNSMDDDGLVKYFPSSRLRGSAVLTAYRLTIADAARFTVPEYDRRQMVDGLRSCLRNSMRRRRYTPSDR